MTGGADGGYLPPLGSRAGTQFNCWTEVMDLESRPLNEPGKKHFDSTRDMRSTTGSGKSTALGKGSGSRNGIQRNGR